MPQEKTYLLLDPRDCPIDVPGRKVSIKGTGDEPVSWVSCRDTARAVVELMKAEKWVSFAFDRFPDTNFWSLF